MKCFVNPFVDIALTFSNSCFNSYSTSTYCVLFEVIFLFKIFSLSSKSVFFVEPTISSLLVKFACANLAAKFFAVNLLNSRVVIYLS